LSVEELLARHGLVPDDIRTARGFIAMDRATPGHGTGLVATLEAIASCLEAPNPQSPNNARHLHDARNLLAEVLR